MRRVDARHRAFPEEARDEMVVLVEREIERCIELELLNDEVFTKLWVEQLHRRGDSLFSIRSKLQKKGVSREVINSQIALFNQESSGNVGFLSAISYARRRGLGPFRRDWSTRETHKKKDIASMIRAGHSYDYVKEIVSSTDITVLLELAEENK
jgi:regulatory protein